MKKLPPIQKILEAYTAIVDNHVNLTENEAKVTSSNGAKTYTVSWENDVYHSMITRLTGKDMLAIP